jgi:hypothetical protein
MTIPLKKLGSGSMPFGVKAGAMARARLPSVMYDLWLKLLIYCPGN